MRKTFVFSSLLTAAGFGLTLAPNEKPTKRPAPRRAAAPRDGPQAGRDG